MLEVLGIYYLCKANKKNAMARGRKPGLFIGLTIGLWIGFEFISAILGIFLDFSGMGYYGFIVFSALLGGLISYLIAKNCSQGTYYSSKDQMGANIQRSSASFPDGISPQQMNPQPGFAQNTAQSQQSDFSERYCRSCGVKDALGGSFCTSCGNRL